MEQAMTISMIPWHVFLDALKIQNPAIVETWLRRWLFTNDGVLLTHAKKVNVSVAADHIVSTIRDEPTGKIPSPKRLVDGLFQG